jgi:hypothetical protein
MAVLLVSLTMVLTFDNISNQDDLLATFSQRRTIAARVHFGMLHTFVVARNVSEIARYTPALGRWPVGLDLLNSDIDALAHIDGVINLSKSPLVRARAPSRLLFDDDVCLRVNPRHCPRAPTDPLYDVSTRGLSELMTASVDRGFSVLGR